MPLCQSKMYYHLMCKPRPRPMRPSRALPHRKLLQVFSKPLLASCMTSYSEAASWPESRPLPQTRSPLPARAVLLTLSTFPVPFPIPPAYWARAWCPADRCSLQRSLPSPTNVAPITVPTPSRDPGPCSTRLLGSCVGSW